MNSLLRCSLPKLILGAPFALTVITLLSSRAWAQEPATPQNVSNAPGENAAGTVSLLSNYEFWLTISVLIFGCFVLAAEFMLLKGVVKERIDDVAKIMIVTLIIISTLVLITAGFGNDQIAPALGLLGTIAGYLLGRMRDEKSLSDEG